MTADQRLSGLLSLICCGLITLVGHGCTSPTVPAQPVAKTGRLSTEALRAAALDAAARRGLLNLDRQYVVYFRALDEGVNTAEAQFISSIQPTFDYPRLKLDTRTGEVLEPSLEVEHASVRAPTAAKPIVITDVAGRQAISEISIRDLAIDIIAREELPRNTDYNIEYRWSADGRQLDVWFRPVWRDTEMSGVVRMTFSAELMPDEE